jgi:mannose-6-phosphate isomerase
MQPFKLEPYLKQVIWGGTAIAEFKGLTPDNASIGESWEVSALPGFESVISSGPFTGRNLGEICREYGPELLGREVYERFGGEFPLLVKLLDAASDLSVQVHPGDDIARRRHGCSGKSEMWYIIATKPGARLVPGFRRSIDMAEFERSVAEGTLDNLLAWYDTAPGDVFYLPAGRIHAICGGNLLAEVQQASDVTYRIYDYGRRDAQGNLRPLHTAEARDAIDLSAQDNYRITPKGEQLIAAPFFKVDRVQLSPDSPRNFEVDSFIVVLCIGGNACVASAEGDVDVSCGHTVLVPASTPVKISGDATLLIIKP